MSDAKKGKEPKETKADKAAPADAALPPATFQIEKVDRKSTRLNSSHIQKSRMPSSA